MSLYLSRIVLNPASPQTRSELARPYEVHRTLAHAFGDLAAARMLFRIDLDDPGRPTLLVQSRQRPDWDSARAHLPHATAHEVVEMSLRWLTEDRMFRFRLLVRPTKRLPSGGAMRDDGKPKDGRRVVLKTNEELFGWLGRQADTHGFRISDAAFDRVYWLDSRGGVGLASSGVDKQGTVVPMSLRQSSEPLLGAVRFDGCLVVTDAKKLREAVENGIGPQKAFGFGLLSLAPMR
jgi:CRISPR system Cascade subunit CasE